MKKNKLLIPFLGVSTIAMSLPLAITSCTNTKARQITADDAVTLNIIKNDNAGIEVVVTTKDTTCHVVSVELTIGSHKLTSGEFSFVKAQGRIVIPKEICEKYSGSVTIKTTNEKKVSIELDRDNFTLFKGKLGKINAIVSPGESVITWSSSDETIATVNNEGYVNAIKVGAATITATVQGVSAQCVVTVTEPVVLTNAVTLTASEPSSFRWTKVEGTNSWLEYSFDGKNFEPVINQDVIMFGDDGSRETVYLRGCFKNYWHESGVGRGNNITIMKGRMNSLATVVISGSLMNLLQTTPGVTPTEMPENCALMDLFSTSDAIVSIDESRGAILPSTNLKPRCYWRMFAYCNSLKNVPTLPATTLAEECYKEMFRQSPNITETTNLMYATNLAKGCYESMFRDCVGLTTTKDLPATVLPEACYYNMYWGCTKLAKAPTMTINTIGTRSCFNMFASCEKMTGHENISIKATSLPQSACCGMFVHNEALTKAPSLDTVIEIDEGSCEQMFMSCTALVDGPQNLPAPTADWCYRNMFDNCVKLKNAPTFNTTIKTTTGRQSCRAMFSGCSALSDNIPTTLPATELGANCYELMFSYCKAMKTAPSLPATTLSDSCYNAMFSGCTSLKVIEGNTVTQIFVCPKAESMGADSVLDMFKNTGGTFTAGTPEAEKTYSYVNE